MTPTLSILNCPPRLSVFLLLPFLSLIAVCSDGFDGFVSMWVWFAPIGVSWVKWWIGMVGRGYFLGIFWHGGPWVFSGYFLAWWIGMVGRFSGYFRC